MENTLFKFFTVDILKYSDASLGTFDIFNFLIKAFFVVLILVINYKKTF